MASRLVQSERAQHIELSTENDIIKKASLLALLEQQSSTNATYDSNDIIAILGGVDKILRDYLSSTDMKLDTSQLTKIAKITTPNPEMQLDQNNNRQRIVYTFSTKNTFYHAWFEQHIASRIINILCSKYLVPIWVLMSLVNGFCYIMASSEYLALFLTICTLILLILRVFYGQ